MHVKCFVRINWDAEQRRTVKLLGRSRTRGLLQSSPFINRLSGEIEANPCCGNETAPSKGLWHQGNRVSVCQLARERGSYWPCFGGYSWWGIYRQDNLKFQSRQTILGHLMTTSGVSRYRGSTHCNWPLDAHLHSERLPNPGPIEFRLLAHHFQSSHVLILMTFSSSSYLQEVKAYTVTRRRSEVCVIHSLISFQ